MQYSAFLCAAHYDRLGQIQNKEVNYTFNYYHLEQQKGLKTAMTHQHLDFTIQIFCECVSSELKDCHQCNKTAPSWEAVLSQRPDSSIPVLKSVQHIPNGPSKLILINIWGKIRLHHTCFQISKALTKLLVIFIHTLLALLRMTYNIYI